MGRRHSPPVLCLSWGVEVSDEELLDLVRTGDEAAFTQLYKRHGAAARRLASSYTGAADADELVDDAFQAVLNALRNGTGPTESSGPTCSSRCGGWPTGVTIGAPTPHQTPLTTQARRTPPSRAP